jgi:hypothetical protein
MNLKIFNLKKKKADTLPLHHNKIVIHNGKEPLDKYYVPSIRE